MSTCMAPLMKRSTSGQRLGFLRDECLEAVSTAMTIARNLGSCVFTHPKWERGRSRVLTCRWHVSRSVVSAYGKVNLKACLPSCNILSRRLIYSLI